MKTKASELAEQLIDHYHSLPERGDENGVKNSLGWKEFLWNASGMLEDFESEINRKDEEIEELKYTVAQLENDNAKLSEEIEKLSEEIQELKSEMRDMEKDIDELEQYNRY